MLFLELRLQFCPAIPWQVRFEELRANEHLLGAAGGPRSAIDFDPGYGATLPPYAPYHGWDCVTDEGQGRFLPCEMGGG
jgi:hypothetical protein